MCTSVKGRENFAEPRALATSLTRRPSGAYFVCARARARACVCVPCLIFLRDPFVRPATSRLIPGFFGVGGKRALRGSEGLKSAGFFVPPLLRASSQFLVAAFAAAAAAVTHSARAPPPPPPPTLVRPRRPSSRLQFRRPRVLAAPSLPSPGGVSAAAFVNEYSLVRDIRRHVAATSAPGLRIRAPCAR